MGRLTICDHYEHICELADKVGSFIEYWGFKKIHGRIWTVLLLSEKPLDATHLVRKLKVSKALVSISIKDLLEYNVIIEAPKISAETQKYSVNPDIMAVIAGVLRNREKRLLNDVQGAFNMLKTLNAEEMRSCGIDSTNLKTLGELIEGGQFALDALLALDLDQVKQWKPIITSSF